MTNRVGSLIVALALGGITLVAVLLIVILVDDEDDGSASPLLTLSIREGQIVLLNRPLQVRVTASDAEPVTRASLFVDDALITQAVPVNDPDRGTYGASLNWIPDRLGEVTLTVTVSNLSGHETRRDVTIEVTDDPVRVDRGVSVSIISPPQLQTVPLGELLSVLARAESEAPILNFALIVNGSVVAEGPPTVVEEGAATAVLRWTAVAEGAVDLTVTVRTAAGQEESAFVTVNVVSGAGAEVGEPSESPEAPESLPGRLTIVTPSDGLTLDFEEGLTIEVVAEMTDTGPLRTVELRANDLTVRSVSPEPRADGTYQVTLSLTGAQPGTYRLAVVAFSESGQRFDDTVTVEVIDPTAPEESDGGAEEEEEEQEPPALPDLVPLQLTADGSGLILTLANSGPVPVAGVAIVLAVVRASDGILLGETTVTLTLGVGATRQVSLPLLPPGGVAITVVVDSTNAVDEADETNNEISGQFQPVDAPDLTVQALELSDDGFALVTVSNIGSANYEGPITVLLIFNGTPTEKLQISSALALQGVLTLAGSIPVTGTGTFTAIVDPDGDIAETNETNNAFTIAVSG